MKKVLFFLAVIIFLSKLSVAQNMFTKEMGPALNMDNSIGTILMDLSTQNKDVLMNGESDKKDTSKKYYPARLFGADGVYISRTIEQNSLYDYLQDESTLGQIYAVFAPKDQVTNMLKALQTNMEKSTVFNMFFKINNDNKDANRIEYVQSKPFALPNNAAKPHELAKYNKGLKENFEEYEIRISIEKGSMVYMGTNYEYPQVRSWVQLKPIQNLTFEIPDNLPTTHGKDTTEEYKYCLQYFNEAKRLNESYEKFKKEFVSAKNITDDASRKAIRKAYILLFKRLKISNALIKFVSESPTFDGTNNFSIAAMGVAAYADATLIGGESKTLIDTFKAK